MKADGWCHAVAVATFALIIPCTKMAFVSVGHDSSALQHLQELLPLSACDQGDSCSPVPMLAVEAWNHLKRKPPITPKTSDLQPTSTQFPPWLSQAVCWAAPSLTCRSFPSIFLCGDFSRKAQLIHALNAPNKQLLRTACGKSARLHPHMCAERDHLQIQGFIPHLTSQS